MCPAASAAGRKTLALHVPTVTRKPDGEVNRGAAGSLPASGSIVMVVEDTDTSPPRPVVDWRTRSRSTSRKTLPSRLVGHTAVGSVAGHQKTALDPDPHGPRDGLERLMSSAHREPHTSYPRLEVMGTNVGNVNCSPASRDKLGCVRGGSGTLSGQPTLAGEPVVDERADGNRACWFRPARDAEPQLCLVRLGLALERPGRVAADGDPLEAPAAVAFGALAAGQPQVLDGHRLPGGRGKRSCIRLCVSRFDHPGYPQQSRADHRVVLETERRIGLKLRDDVVTAGLSFSRGRVDLDRRSAQGADGLARRS